MTDDLTKKIRDIIWDHTDPTFDGQDSGDGVAIAIEQITQAFIDAGYSKHDWSITPGSVVIDDVSHMTGQEWYDKFWMEMEMMIPMTWYTREDPGHEILDREQILNLAKKAAGIDS